VHEVSRKIFIKELIMEPIEIFVLFGAILIIFIITCGMLDFPLPAILKKVIHAIMFSCVFAITLQSFGILKDHPWTYYITVCTFWTCLMLGSPVWNWFDFQSQKRKDIKLDNLYAQSLLSCHSV
jgi:K+-sensing histidine kinase KdpD